MQTHFETEGTTPRVLQCHAPTRWSAHGFLPFLQVESACYIRSRWHFVALVCTRYFFMNEGAPKRSTLDRRNHNLDLENALWYNPGSTIDRRIP